MTPRSVRARILRDIIRLGIFASIKDLDKRLTHYVRRYNIHP